MADRTYLHWPFFEGSHRELAERLHSWCEGNSQLFQQAYSLPLDDACRNIVATLGKAGWLKYVVPKAYGGIYETLDVRSICLIRETLAQRSGLVEFCFAMQGLGVGPITLFGSEALKNKVLPGIASGQKIGAFAISELEAGSDLNAMTTSARRDAKAFVIAGEKTWISNAGIADYYVVFCRMFEEKEKRFTAFLVDASNPGLKVTSRIDVLAPHPLGTITLHDCRVSEADVVGEPGKGMHAALGTLDVFRATVGAAALGFSRRALDESVAHVQQRKAFGQTLADFQLTQAKLAEMATSIDASAMLVYRAAWVRDTTKARITREAAMAKLHATESAQKIVDEAVQLLGAKGVVSGHPVERLYREVRALRIYEGASEIQKLIIASQLLKETSGASKA
jgi:acyl-CoA dehydrogenase